MEGGEGEGGVLRPGDLSLVGEDLEDGLNPGDVLEDGLYPGEVLEAGLYPGGSMSSILGFGNLYPERDGGKLRCKLNSSLEK